MADDWVFRLERGGDDPVVCNLSDGTVGVTKWQDAVASRRKPRMAGQSVFNDCDVSMEIVIAAKDLAVVKAKKKAIILLIEESSRWYCGDKGAECIKLVVACPGSGEKTVEIFRRDDDRRKLVEVLDDVTESGNQCCTLRLNFTRRGTWLDVPETVERTVGSVGNQALMAFGSASEVASPYDLCVQLERGAGTGCLYLYESPDAICVLPRTVGGVGEAATPLGSGGRTFVSGWVNASTQLDQGQYNVPWGNFNKSWSCKRYSVKFTARNPSNADYVVWFDTTRPGSAQSKTRKVVVKAFTAEPQVYHAGTIEVPTGLPAVLPMFADLMSNASGGSLEVDTVVLFSTEHLNNRVLEIDMDSAAKRIYSTGRCQTVCPTATNDPYEDCVTANGDTYLAMTGDRLYAYALVPGGVNVIPRPGGLPPIVEVVWQQGYNGDLSDVTYEATRRNACLAVTDE